MSNHETFKGIIDELDALTKNGQRLQVLKRLTVLLKSRLGKNERPQLARIANRNQAHLLALRLLYPLIRNDREKIEAASAEALNIYATSLMWIGALEESQKFLMRIKGSTDSLLTQAFLYFAKWDYTSAIPILERYVGAKTITPYQKLVGRVNLLAACISCGEIPRARKMCLDLLIDLKNESNARMLYGNCLELKSQIEILEGHFEDSLVSLAESEKILSEQKGRYLLYVEKWRAIAQLGLTHGSAEALKNLGMVRSKAITLKNWETVRDCDFYESRFCERTDDIQKILAVTPYPGYHRRIEQIFGFKYKKQNKIVICPESALRKATRVGFSPHEIRDVRFFSTTAWPLVQVLTKDGYRPARMGDVFCAIYKNEYFDPFTSPQRVRNTVYRFNQWAEKEKIDFRIKILKGEFRLFGPEGLGLEINPRRRLEKRWESLLKLFQNDHRGRSFTATEFANAIKVSRRQALNILTEASATHRLQKMGSGKNTRYIFRPGKSVKSLSSKNQYSKWKRAG